MRIQPLGSLRHAPRRIRPPFDVGVDLHRHEAPTARRDDKVVALLEALDGIELGAHDQRIIASLAEWETATVGTFVSLLYRVQAAGGRS